MNAEEADDLFMEYMLATINNNTKCCEYASLPIHLPRHLVDQWYVIISIDVAIRRNCGSSWGRK